MNKNWSNSTAEFKTIEDARAFVKKYGKTLKSELEEKVDNTSKELYNNTEVLDMKKEELEESTNKDAEFDLKFSKYVDKPLSSEEFHKLMRDMRDFYGE